MTLGDRSTFSAAFESIKFIPVTLLQLGRGSVVILVFLAILWHQTAQKWDVSLVGSAVKALWCNGLTLKIEGGLKAPGREEM